MSRPSPGRRCGVLGRRPAGRGLAAAAGLVRRGDRARAGQGAAAAGDLGAGLAFRGGAELDMSYMRAWRLVHTMNACFAEPLVELSRGGREQGGAILTPTGVHALSLYREMERLCREAIATPWKELASLLAPPRQLDPGVIFIRIERIGPKETLCAVSLGPRAWPCLESSRLPPPHRYSAQAPPAEVKGAGRAAILTLGGLIQAQAEGGDKRDAPLHHRQRPLLPAPGAPQRHRQIPRGIRLPARAGPHRLAGRILEPARPGDRPLHHLEPQPVGDGPLRPVQVAFRLRAALLRSAPADHASGPW